MTTAFEVGVEFLAREDLKLGAVDLLFGLERDWLDARTVIDWATVELSRGNDDPAIEELACLLPADEARVPEVLELPAPAARMHRHAGSGCTCS